MDKDTTNKTAVTLYGIGVGPGDPELMTLKSVNILKHVDIVFAAASTKNDYSLAVSIARPHIPETTQVKILPFPMTKDQNETRKAWSENAKTIIHDLKQGRNGAFITLGDALTYSTFGYILKHVQQLAPDIHIESIPGITSYQAAASRVNLPLVEGEETLMIMSGVNGGGCLRNLNQKPENIVFLKAYKNIDDIIDSIKESDFIQKSVGITSCGLPEEKIVTDINQFSTMPPDYWTLIIAKHNKNGSK
jgi:precorrin-2/cobalt-factor-2 C20-methyltransferase